MSDEARRELLGKIPLGRFGDPAEVWLTLRYILEYGSSPDGGADI
ncbi:MAG: hypothetical protein ACJ8J0_16085 [Longimicrobiaceae bacterium]